MRNVARLLFLGLVAAAGCGSENSNDTIPQTNQAVQRPRVGNTILYEMPKQGQPPTSYPGAAPANTQPAASPDAQAPQGEGTPKE